MFSFLTDHKKYHVLFIQLIKIVIKDDIDYQKNRTSKIGKFLLIFMMKHCFLKESFTDFDALSYAVQDWDIDFSQLDTGPLHADLIQFDGINSLIAHARFSRQFDQRGTAPPNFWTFAIFSEKSPPLVWHNKEIDHNYIVIYRPGSEIDCVSRPGFEVFTFSFSEKVLNQVAHSRSLPDIQKLLKGGDHIIVSEKDLFVTRRLIRELIQYADSLELIRKEKVLHSYEEEILRQIISILARSQPQKNVSPRARNRAIKKIKDFLAADPYEPVMVSQLSSIAEVSERTLRYAFLEHYGVSPKTYLKNFRLNRVRRELWKSDPLITRVNDIATIWGFWHMGQFAADYRKLFGELPSETLQRGK